MYFSNRWRGHKGSGWAEATSNSISRSAKRSAIPFSSLFLHALFPPTQTKQRSTFETAVSLVIPFLYFPKETTTESKELISSAEVRLDSIEIFNTHDWITEPTVYFACKGENTTVVPDVTKKDVVYSFKGEESWQPFTELESKKCKRCGFYEKDFIKSDDVFNEWEFCASDFNANGKYMLFKENELNVTFDCQECTSLPSGAKGTGFETGDDGNKTRVAIIVLIVLAVLIVTVIAMAMAYKYWQKKKRQQDQARFLKLFEEGDDLEDELELSNSI